MKAFRCYPDFLCDRAARTDVWLGRYFRPALAGRGDYITRRSGPVLVGHYRPAGGGRPASVLRSAHLGSGIAGVLLPDGGRVRRVRCVGRSEEPVVVEHIGPAGLCHRHVLEKYTLCGYVISVVLEIQSSVGDVLLRCCAWSAKYPSKARHPSQPVMSQLCIALLNLISATLVRVETHITPVKPLNLKSQFILVRIRILLNLSLLLLSVRYFIIAPARFNIPPSARLFAMLRFGAVVTGDL